MAKVRCACGRQYAVPDKHLGQQVKCAACSRVFIAAAVEPQPSTRGPAPAPPAAPAAVGRSARLGELAVARGLISRGQLDACLKYQQAIHRLRSQRDQTLGSILVSKRLLTQAQLDRLLAEQQGAAVEAAGASVEAARRRAEATTPVTEAQRESLRRSVEAAKQQQADKRAAAPERPSLLSKLLRPRYLAIAGGVAVLALLALVLWPDPPAQRTLVSFLEGCDELRVTPDTHLALTDFGLAVREFRDVTLLPQARYSYADELAAFGKEEGRTWDDLLVTVPMAPEKYEALWYLAIAIPRELGPRSIGGLEITVQRATCYLAFKPRGMGMYSRGLYRFLLLKAKSPKWRLGWRVAGYEPVRVMSK